MSIKVFLKIWFFKNNILTLSWTPSSAFSSSMIARISRPRLKAANKNALSLYKNKQLMSTKQKKITYRRLRDMQPYKFWLNTEYRILPDPYIKRIRDSNDCLVYYKKIKKQDIRILNVDLTKNKLKIGNLGKFAIKFNSYCSFTK